ncbi:MAG: aldo/keto reductase [Opitutaceae bacterium]
MEYTELGRTGLQISVAGLGCGGHSRLGLAHGRSENEAADVVRCAVDHGVNLIDTARYYGTEAAVGAAARDRNRASLVLCTKIPIRREGGLIDPDRIRSDLEESLKQLKTDVVDVLYLHGVAETDYAFAVSECLPVMEGLRQSGKVRFIGVTESFSVDQTHAMLTRATRDPCWDVVMVGFNILNQTARQTILPQAREGRIGTTLMFAVRRALSRPAALRDVVRRLVSQGHDQLAELDPDNPLDFLLRPGGAATVTEAAYRFCRHEPGVDCVLFGTGNLDHIPENIASILGPPLPTEDTARLRELFGSIDSESGN